MSEQEARESRHEHDAPMAVATVAAPRPGATRSWRKPVILLIGGALLVVAAFYARKSLGIQLDPQALRRWILDLGPIAPVVMIALIAGRALLALPSQLVLIVAGLAFGTALGTVYGSIGLVISALGTFLAARYAGRDAVTRHVPPRIATLLETAGERPGALLVAFATGYPIGFITAYHGVAGITSMRLGVFALAVTVGSTVRAATYCYFGSSLVEGGLTPILQATALLALLFGVPLLVPSVRRWVARIAFAR